MHRLLSIGMAQHDAQRPDIARKSRFTPLTRSAVYPGPPIRMKIGLTCGCLLYRYAISNFVNR
jgi:hypothetical protein